MKVSCDVIRDLLPLYTDQAGQCRHGRPGGGAPGVLSRLPGGAGALGDSPAGGAGGGGAPAALQAAGGGGGRSSSP